MRKLKSSVKTAVVSTLALTSTAAIIYAVPNLASNEAKTRDIGDKLKLDVEKIDSDTVKVSIDNVQDIPKSIQFSVKLDGNVKLANGESSIRDLIKPQVQARLANNEYVENSNDILADYTYNQDSNTIDVLITSENSLPKFGNKIEVFELDLTSSNTITKQGGTTYKVVPNNEDEYKYLSVTNKEYNDLGVVSDDETLSLNTAPTITTSKEFIKIVEGEILKLTADNLGIIMSDEDENSDTLKLEVKDLSQSNKPEITEFIRKTPGLYTIECVAVDSAGEKSQPITIQIYVEYDNVTTEPKITRDGQALETNITINGGDIFKPLENVKAVDAKGRELEVKVTTDNEINLDPENDTTYVLTYTAVDSYGNEAKIQVNLNVIANKAPVISGVQNHTLKVGDSFDPRKDVMVSDEDVDIELTVDSNVNTKIAGEYKVSYSATDSKGKTTRVQSTVTVNPKTSTVTSIPIIVGNNTTIKFGEKFNSLDIVRVYNNKGEDITSTVDIEVLGDNVDTNKEGSYTVTYKVKGQNGVTATKTITITVVKEVILANEIKISNKFNHLYIGASKEISAAVNEDADIQNVEWSVSGDTNVLDFEVKGNNAKITAIGEGKAVVTATTTDGTKISDSFEVNVEDFTKEDVIPETIINVIDTNIVTPVSGEGNETSPVELEVKNVTEEEFINFTKDLNKSNAKIVDTIETNEFTIYKIKLTKARLFARNTEYFVELKINNSLNNATKFKATIEKTLKDNNISSGSTSQIPDNSNNIKVKELAGQTRYETAIKVSQERFKDGKANAVVLVGKDAVVDGLAAAPLANSKNAPILFADSNTITSETKQEILRVLGNNLSEKTIYIVGGEARISKSVEAMLAKLGVKVERVAGETRYETSLEVAKHLNSNSKVAFVVGGNGEADAMSISSKSAELKAPIVVVNKDNLNEDAKSLLTGKEIYVIGGTNVVSKEVETELDKLDSNKDSDRIAGLDRKETNAKVISTFYKSEDILELFVAKDGYVGGNDKLVDALAAAPLAGTKSAPIILTTEGLNEIQKENIKGLNKISKVVQVGYGISKDVINSIVELIKK